MNDCIDQITIRPSVSQVTVTPPPGNSVTVSPVAPQVKVFPEVLGTLKVASPAVSVKVSPTGLPGPPGAPGEPGAPGAPGPVQLFDSLLPPVDPPSVYLRFERDRDGDVQRILIGTVD